MLKRSKRQPAMNDPGSGNANRKRQGSRCGRLIKLLLTLLTIYLPGCEKTDDKLFWINENTEHRSDFLFMAESTNVERLKGDSLKLFFGDQLKTIDTTSATFKNFGKIYQGEKFSVFILLQIIEAIGRNYVFIIHTYDRDFRIIDTFELAIWDESEKQYCFGSIDKDLIIERKCNYKKSTDIMQITSEGEIIMTSSHKP